MTNSKSDDLSNLSQPMRAQVRLELPKNAYGEDDGEGLSMLNGAGRERRMVAAYRPLTIHEDETVLVCCTHAHEIARAHGAREVMLEHLIHALARVPEAITTLEERGFQVEPLRRESAAIIAGEIPVDQPSNNAAIRASKDFNTVMHLAAAKASGHDERSLGVRDLLDALLGYDPKSRAVRLLKKFRSGADAEETPDPLMEVRTTLDRYTTEVRELRLSVVELKDAQRAASVSQQTNGDTRLNAIEQKLATVLAEVVSDRQANGDRSRGIQDWASAQRSDMANLQRVIGDRLTLVEKAMQAQNGGIQAGQTHSLINDRFLSLQKSHETSRADMLRVEASVSDRMKSLERHVENHTAMLGSNSGGASPKDLQALVDRLASLERVIEVKQFDSRGLEAAMTDKLKAFERTVEGQVGGSTRSWTAMSDRLFALERAVGAQRAETQGIQQLVASEMKMLEKTLSAAAEHRVNGGGNGFYADPELGGRFASLEKSIEAMRAERPGDGQVGERLRVFERLLESQLGSATKSFSSLGDRLQVLEKSMNMQRTDVVSINNALDDELEQVRKALVALGHAQQTLSQAIDEWRLNNSGDLSIISNRLAALERTPAYAPISVQPNLSQALQQAASPLVGDKANSVRARLGIPTT